MKDWLRAMNNTIAEKLAMRELSTEEIASVAGAHFIVPLITQIQYGPPLIDPPEPPPELPSGSVTFC
jgi:hypothetical protein